MPKANEHVVVIGGTSGIGLSLARTAHALGLGKCASHQN